MRLVDADALQREVGKLWETEPDGIELCKEVMKAVNHAPTIDAVPVVRCKDCKWWDGRTWDEKGEPLYGYCNACKHGHYSSNWEISIFRKYKADWFCADGERKV